MSSIKKIFEIREKPPKGQDEVEIEWSDDGDPERFYTVVGWRHGSSAETNWMGAQEQYESGVDEIISIYEHDGHGNNEREVPRDDWEDLFSDDQLEDMLMRLNEVEVEDMRSDPPDPYSDR